MSSRSFKRRVSALVVLLVVSPLSANEPPVPVKPKTAIQVAASDETLRFAAQGALLFPNATAPDLVQLPNGHLLAVMDIVTDKTTTLSVARSADGGKTWTAPRPIFISNMLPEVTGAHHGNLVITSQGLVRLYFSASINEMRRGRSLSIIASALSSDGLTYHFDPQVRINTRYRGTLAGEAVPLGDEILLFVTETESPEGTRRAPRTTITVLHSADGRRFQPLNRMRESCSICDVATGRQGELRLFHVTPEGIASMISYDGRRWQPEEGLRFAGSSDAAICEMSPQPEASAQYLMLCCTQPDKPFRQPVYADGTGSDGDGNADGWQPFTDSIIDDAYTNGESWDNTLPPSLNLESFTDYIQWVTEHLSVPEGGNACDAYANVMAAMDACPLESPFNNCLDSVDWDHGPIPWDPADYPQWEEAYQRNLGWTDSFRAAALDPRPYRSPLDFSESDRPYEDRLLVEIPLPNFAKMRGLARATLANGWRMDEGIVPPDSMRDSWKTVLGNARQLRGDYTTIGALVSLAQQQLVETNARHALQWNIFNTEEELETALKTLEDNDTAWQLQPAWVKGEYAMWMDMVQYPLSRNESGEVIVDRDRLMSAYQMAFGDENPTTETIAALDALTVEDFAEAGEILDDYGQRLKDTFDTEFSIEGIEQAEKFERDIQQCENEIAKHMVPSIGRVYVIMMRGEASRRATQLSYGIHLFKKRYGRWPTTLDELSDIIDPDAMIDPYSQEYFRYYPTEDGSFKLYSIQDNGLDDGGVHNPDRHIDPKSESDDIVYWPLPD